MSAYDSWHDAESLAALLGFSRRFWRDTIAAWPEAGNHNGRIFVPERAVLAWLEERRVSQGEALLVLERHFSPRGLSETRGWSADFWVDRANEGKLGAVLRIAGELRVPSSGVAGFLRGAQAVVVPKARTMGELRRMAA